MFAIATEDELSELVAKRLVTEAFGVAPEFRLFRNNGFGYLKTNIDKFIDLAKQCPVFVLTDLDQLSCAPALRTKWLGEKFLPSKFLFRIAVREVESWLLADRNAFADFLGVVPAKIPQQPEALQDPKKHLLQIARKARSDVKKDLLPTKGAAASQGFGYNARLGEFVSKDWCPRRASEQSDSLKRAQKSLASLQSVVQPING